LRYATAFDFRRALESRLLVRSRETAAPLAWLRKQVAFDRFLTRLLHLAPDRWILKGALALDYRLADRARTSKDMDLAYRGLENDATEQVLAASALDLGDFFSFQVERTAKLDELVGGAAVRYHTICRLGRSIFDEATIDVGFTDSFEVIELVKAPPLLDFADIQTLEAPTLPLVEHIAQKLHAYVRVYGLRGQPSTRTKDLADLVIISSYFSVRALALRRAVVDTFAVRITPLPPEVPAPPDEWHRDYPRIALRLGLDPNLEAAHRAVSAFLDPILRSDNPPGVWDPSAQQWIAGEIQAARA